jgi:hypothetical protein
MARTSAASSSTTTSKDPTGNALSHPRPDCGSCSASAVADGIVFEAAGLPAAAICSDAFKVTADAMAGLRGAPGYRYATTPHPVAVLTPDQVKERAARVLDDVVALLAAASE